MRRLLSLVSRTIRFGDRQPSSLALARPALSKKASRQVDVLAFQGGPAVRRPLRADLQAAIFDGISPLFPLVTRMSSISPRFIASSSEVAGAYALSNAGDRSLPNS